MRFFQVGSGILFTFHISLITYCIKVIERNDPKLSLVPFRLFVLFLCFFFSQTTIYASEDELITSPSGKTYHLISQIGDGDKSEIFLAKDENEIYVAIKRMYIRDKLTENYSINALEAMFNPEGLSLIAENEFKIGQEIKHPNILRIYDLFSNIDPHGTLQTYLITEFIDGDTLRQTSPKSHSKEKALQNCIDLLAALHHAYKCNYVYYDLHSSNVMFNKNQEIKLIDLDSFSPIDPEISFTNYLEKIIALLHNILICGDFNDDEITNILFEMIANKSYAKGSCTAFPSMVMSQYVRITRKMSG